MANSIGPKLHTLFNQMFGQVLTISVHPSKIELIESLSNKISDEITKLSTEVSLEKCKLLNDAVQKAFQLVAEDMTKMNDRIKKLEDQNK